MSAAWSCERCRAPVGAHCNPLTGDSRRALCYECAVREQQEPEWRRYTRAAVAEAVRYAWYVGTMDAMAAAVGYPYETLPADMKMTLLARSKSAAMELTGTIQLILDVVDGYTKPDGPRVRPEVN